MRNTWLTVKVSSKQIKSTMNKHILLLLCILPGWLASCKNKQAAMLQPDEYYTCSMHPQIMENKPGHCPVCHMELILAKKTSTAMDEILLNDEQIRLGNIQTAPIGNASMGDNIIVTATLNADETRINSINARVMGRIDRLYFKNIGAYVSKGAHLYDLYSEALNNAKQEYLVAMEKRKELNNAAIDFSRLIEAAKTKLLLWGMSETQIAALGTGNSPNGLTAFYSPAEGYITELPVMEGQYVNEGSTIAKLADLSNLWAEAQLYTSQLPSLDLQSVASIQVPDLPEKEWKGKIEFANPEIGTDSRLDLLRVSISNGGGLLKPGMPAYMNIRSREIKTLTLPADAVLRDGKMNTVWVQSGDHRFKMKMVETGLETGDQVAIKAGLQNGDLVVIHGAYLLHSEYVFKKGGDAMGGMKH